MRVTNNKKSQMEIMGLAIVVVLLVLGMLFAIRFVLMKEPEKNREEYTNTQLAANMLNTILNTNSDCNKISISELLQDASKAYPTIVCQGYSTQEDYLRITISSILIRTLNISKKQYHFKASVPDKTVVSIGTEFSNKVRERKTHFLTTDAGTMTVIFDIYS